MAKTQYTVSIWLAKKEEQDFRQALAKYNQRERYSHDYHVQVVASQDVPETRPSSVGPYVELSIACADVLALFRFGEFWGNKTMQRWEREHKQDVSP